MTKTSWGKVSRWYDKSVGDEGHYYHQSVILPKLLQLMNLEIGDRVLDLGCGQGILGKKISRDIFYRGVDISKELITLAQRSDASSQHKYIAADVTRGLPGVETDFTHIVFLLSLQNMQDMRAALKNACANLSAGGKLYLVLNHPTFRIPRHSGWGIDPTQNIEYRRVSRYLSPLEIPINMEPGNRNSSKLTWSYHAPLSVYSSYLKELGLVMKEIQEWISDKTSSGKAAKRENLARKEIPLFMCLVCQRAG